MVQPPRLLMHSEYMLAHGLSKLDPVISCTSFTSVSDWGVLVSIKHIGETRYSLHH